MSGNLRNSTEMQRAALLTFVASLLFWAFFQISKLPEFAAVNAFAEDPVDAIGSIAVQVAVAVSLLTLARAVQAHHTPEALTYKSRWIVHGNSVALLAITITLAADTWMQVQHPVPGNSPWGQLLLIGLGTVGLIVFAAVVITWVATLHSKAESAATGPAFGEAGSLGEALSDLWALARLILAWFRRHIPWLNLPLRWVDELGNRMFEWLMNWPWIGPRAHPWRFCAVVGLALGIALAAAHELEEGPALNLTTTILLGTIFIAVEVVAMLAGFLLLGGFLGLRPPLRLRR